jgi:hypothetical protein
VIYCVVPRELADRLLEPLTAHYADDPHVTVIVDRRRGDRRSRAGKRTADVYEQRELRDRRRRRVPGDLPRV